MATQPVQQPAAPEAKQIRIYPGNLPHIKWIELHADGVVHECAVMKEDPNGNITYIEINHLDDFDKRRLVDILTTRNAGNLPLYEIMGNITLRNGINALEYFHQLVKIITPSGKILDPRMGQLGVPTGQMQAPTAR